MKKYDIGLIVVTVVVLAALGVLALGGTLYVWWASDVPGGFPGSLEYEEYAAVMNRSSLPLFIALVLSLVLCIPKRIIRRAHLVWVTLGIFLVSAAVSIIADPLLGASVMFLTAIAIQAAVIVMTLVGSKSLNFQTEGFFSQLGSGLLHLGTVLFLYDVLLLSTSSISHSLIFWSATFLITSGMILSFYQKELSRLFVFTREVQEPQTEDPKPERD